MPYVFSLYNWVTLSVDKQNLTFVFLPRVQIVQECIAHPECCLVRYSTEQATWYKVFVSEKKRTKTPSFIQVEGWNQLHDVKRDEGTSKIRKKEKKK